MSLENFFQRLSFIFLFVFSVLFLFLYGVLGAVCAGLACACMLVSVTFNVAMREVWMLLVLRRKEFQKKATVPYPSSAMLHVSLAAGRLIENGFEYETEIDGLEIFRKRK